MGLVPHSGNMCSGLCETPCAHLDCWQCSAQRTAKALESLEGQPIMPQQVGGIKYIRFADQVFADQALGTFDQRHQLQQYEGMDKDEVIRQLQSRLNTTEKRLKNAEEQIARLEGKRQTVMREAADMLAKNSAAAMDEAARKMLTAKAVAEAATNQLSADGATPEDIEAAKSLLGTPLPDNPKAKKPVVIDPAKIQARVQAMTQLEAIKRQLDTKLISWDEASKNISIDTIEDEVAKLRLYTTC